VLITRTFQSGPKLGPKSFLPLQPLQDADKASERPGQHNRSVDSNGSPCWAAALPVHDSIHHSIGRVSAAMSAHLLSAPLRQAASCKRLLHLFQLHFLSTVLYAGSQHWPHALAVRARHRTLCTLQTCRAARSSHTTQVLHQNTMHCADRPLHTSEGPRPYAQR
jgi:hypothetical protein